MVDLKESLEGVATLAEAERERWAKEEAWVGTFTLLGCGEKREATLGCWKKWVGRIEARESDSEAVANGSVVEQGTTASCSSDDLDSGFSVIWVLGSIFASEKRVEDKLIGVFYLWFGLLCPPLSMSIRSEEHV